MAVEVSLTHWRSFAGLDLMNSLWIPQLMFTNHLELISLYADSASSLTVRRMGEAHLPEENDVRENYFFSGAENLLLYNDTYELEFHCDFNLHTYPFDTQTCFISVTMFQ
jgi:hypothetical protein